MEDLLRDAFDPEIFLHFMRSQGTGQAGKAMGQPGFDPYEVLRLDRDASDEEVKKRYRELLHKLHPDTAGVEGTEFLVRVVVMAYEVIKRERGWT
jgi:DnaJ-class molecular chaperone